jgi:hypothetical protein
LPERFVLFDGAAESFENNPVAPSVPDAFPNLLLTFRSYFVHQYDGLFFRCHANLVMKATPSIVRTRYARPLRMPYWLQFRAIRFASPG